MKKYILDYYAKNKETGEIYPFLNASTVKNREEFFEPEGYPENNYLDKFYDQEREFDYMVPGYLSESMENLEPDTICDMHGWIVSGPMGGKFLPVSKRLKELLEQFNLSPSKFYSGKVLFKGEFYPYYVWLLLSKNYESYINFEKSTFCEWKKAFKKKIGDQEEKVNSIPELKKLKKDKKWRTWGFNRAVMKSEFKENDCCYFPTLGYVISERLKNAIEEAGMTGLKIEECPVEFEYAD